MKNTLRIVRQIRKRKPSLFYCQTLPLKLSQLEKQTDWVSAGLCPFHNDEEPGSFYISLDKRIYKCPICGAAGWDIFAFMHLNFDMSFEDILKALPQYVERQRELQSKSWFST